MKRGQEDRRAQRSSTTRSTIIAQKLPDQEPIEVFTQAVDNVKPMVEVRSQARRRRELPGPARGQAQPPAVARVPLAPRGRRATRRASRMSVRARRGALRRLQERGRRDHEAREHAQDGGGEQDVRSLRLVGSSTGSGLAGRRRAQARAVCRDSTSEGSIDTVKPLRHFQDPEHRHRRAHRRRQDHRLGAHPLLHRQGAPDGRGPRGHGHDGLPARGAGARHHDQQRRDDLRVARRHDQPDRHARPRRLHGRGRALAARPRRRGRRLLRRRRRRGPVRDRLAPGEQVQRPAHRFVNKMDRIGADYFKAVRLDQGAARREPGPGAHPDGRREGLRRASSTS